MESESPPDQKPSASSQQGISVPASKSPSALGTGPAVVTNNPSSSKSGGKSKRSPQRRSTSLEANMQRSASPPANASTVKYTRTGRVSKATKGQPIHHCEDCGKTYSRAEHLRRHQQNHKSDAFPCDVVGCSRSFFREDLLARHKARHNDPLDPPTRRTSIVSHTSGGLHPATPQPPPGSSIQRSTSTLHEDETTPANLQNSAPTTTSQPATSRSPGKYLPLNTLSLASAEPISVNTSGPYLGHPIRGPYELSNSISPTSYDSPPNEYTSGSYPPCYSQPYLTHSGEESIASFYGAGGLQDLMDSPISAGSSTCYTYDLGTRYQSEDFSHNSSSSSLQGLHSAEIHRFSSHRYNLQLAENGRASMLSAEERDSMEEEDLAIPDAYPSLLTIQQRYLHSYWKWIHPLYPLLHQPSFDLEAASPLLRASMLALGARMLQDGYDQSNARILHEKAIKILEKRSIESSHSYQICDMQAIVLIEICSTFKARRPPLQFSSIFLEVYNRLAQDLEAFTLDPVGPLREGQQHYDLNEQMWRTGLPTQDCQCKQRLLLVCYVLDQQNATLFGRNMITRTTMSGMSLPFPRSQLCWDAPIEQQAERRYRRRTSDMPCQVQVFQAVSALPLMTQMAQYPHDAFRSSLIMACLVDPQSDIQSWGFDSGDHLDLSPVLLATEQTPHTTLACHVLMMCKYTPIRDLLAVAGESWCIAEKLGTEADYTAAQKLVLKWARGRTDQICNRASASHQWPVERALHHARMILSIHRKNPMTGLIFQEWAIYLAALVIWARAYVIPTPPCREQRLSIPSPTEPKLSTQELDSAIQRVVSCDTTTVDRVEARNVVLWVKAQIESVDSGHTCGLTNSALDVLGKLATGGNEEGRWFGTSGGILL